MTDKELRDEFGKLNTAIISVATDTAVIKQRLESGEKRFAEMQACAHEFAERISEGEKQCGITADRVSLLRTITLSGLSFLFSLLVGLIIWIVTHKGIS